MASINSAYGKGGNAKKKKKSQSVKQRMRSIKRLLDKPDLPATVRVSQERMLDLLQNKLSEEQQTKKEAKMVKKYKMVKFFEKRKLWRQQRALTKELKNSPSTRKKELKRLQKKIQSDVNYVEYFPRDRKYISLFPARPYSNPNVIGEQEELYEYINKKVGAGELPQATFSKNVLDATSKTKRNHKLSRLSIYGDEKNSASAKPGSGKNDLKTSLDGDDFFMDTSGDATNLD